jgi:hypothetical protein
MVFPKVKSKQYKHFLHLGTPLLCSWFKVWALAMTKRKPREKAQQLVNLEPKDFNNNNIKN